jgi:hypothetical protein
MEHYLMGVDPHGYDGYTYSIVVLKAEAPKGECICVYSGQPYSKDEFNNEMERLKSLYNIAEENIFREL